MKKRLWIPILAGVLLAVLFVPVPRGHYDDGGTREFTALTYKIVRWNKVTADGTYRQTRVYWLRDAYTDIDTLWKAEWERAEKHFRATVVEVNGNIALVEPLEGEEERRSSSRISFSIAGLADIEDPVGKVVDIGYVGGIMETYPAQLRVVSWAVSGDLRHLVYEDAWLDKATAEQYDHIFSDIIITKIYKNCFFARTVVPLPYEIKLNGTLSDEWCVGDQVVCTYENAYYDSENHRIEVDFRTVDTSDFELEEMVEYKPVIYLYPEKETAVTVTLALDGELTCTYPAYADGWRVTAAPDGTLTDAAGQTYNYLYWEGNTNARYDLSKGFCVAGADTAAFLEDALAALGLTRREANEFIVYWLPQMEQNPYNIIAFQTDVYTDAAQLAASPAPDTLIRVFMAYTPSAIPIEISPQPLTAPARHGFTGVERGGTRVE